MPEQVNWFELVCRWCQLEGLQPADAEDCVWQTFERYHRKRKAYPWEEGEPDLLFLHRKAKDVTLDFKRKQARHERLLAQAVVLLPRVAIANAEEVIVEHMDTQAFLEQLPKRLRRFARLRQQGYTLQEAAKQMNIALGTAKRYNHELKRRLIEFYGEDATFLQSHGGIKGGSARKRKLPHAKQEVINNETMDRLAFDSSADGSRNDDYGSDPNPESSAGGGGLVPQIATVAKLDKHVAIAVTSSIPLIRPHALTALPIAFRHPFAAQSMADMHAIPALSGGRNAASVSTRCSMPY